MESRLTRGWAARCAWLGASITMLSGCVPAPDWAGVQAERGKPVQRYDTFQALASHGSRVVAGAAGGVILTSTDGGAHWARHVLAQPSSVVAVAACPDGSFAALDFYKKVWVLSATGGEWSMRQVPTRSDLLALTCDPRNRLWAVGARTSILWSTDHGASWQARDLGDDAILTTVQFVDDRRAVITGEFGAVLTSADGGANWQPQPKIEGDFYPYAALFTDTANGWVSGLAGVIKRTRDGGRTWTTQANPSGVPMYALLRVADELYGLGAGGRMVKLQGEQWQAFEHGQAIPAYLSAGVALDARSMLVAGAAGALNVIHLSTQVAQAPTDTKESR
ncbi:YCF48-related protein [Roseateles sp.]|uniref:YCF48-related protein n=1 Tax=Roseateles sp. TaxID=1971397 RepID=UPI0035A1CBAE